VDLDKTQQPLFPDEWDYVIENFTAGTNDPDIIDSIALIARQKIKPEAPPQTLPDEKMVVVTPPPVIQRPAEKPLEKIVTPQQETLPVAKISEPVKPVTIEDKFISRKKILTTEIPVSGDSIELRFYDNAEIDGDSISLFLNDKLIFQHIRLLGSAYIIKLPVSELGETNELIMVAENLGSIPPNTSYMVAIVDDKRYEARLESTEGSSAMVRFVKKKSGSQ
jgi:hypothetical protein